MNTATLKPNDKRPRIEPSSWKNEQIAKSNSQVNLPVRKIDAFSHGSQASIANEDLVVKKTNNNHFKGRIKSNAVNSNTTGKAKKESEDHSAALNYLKV